MILYKDVEIFLVNLNRSIMFTVWVNEIDYCIILCSTVVCTELCTLLLIIVTNKNVYDFCVGYIAY